MAEGSLQPGEMHREEMREFKGRQRDTERKAARKGERRMENGEVLGCPDARSDTHVLD